MQLRPLLTAALVAVCHSISHESAVKNNATMTGRNRFSPSSWAPKAAARRSTSVALGYGGVSITQDVWTPMSLGVPVSQWLAFPGSATFSVNITATPLVVVATSLGLGNTDLLVAKLRPLSTLIATG